MAIVALMAGFRPSRLPPALLDLAAYKLAAVAALGLLSAGAMLGRRGSAAGLPPRASRQLGERAASLPTPTRPAAEPLPLDGHDDRAGA